MTAFLSTFACICKCRRGPLRLEAVYKLYVGGKLSKLQVVDSTAETSLQRTCEMVNPVLRLKAICHQRCAIVVSRRCFALFIVSSPCRLRNLVLLPRRFLFDLALRRRSPHYRGERCRRRQRHKISPLGQLRPSPSSRGAWPRRCQFLHPRLTCDRDAQSQRFLGGRRHVHSTRVHLIDHGEEFQGVSRDVTLFDIYRCQRQSRAKSSCALLNSVVPKRLHLVRMPSSASF